MAQTRDRIPRLWITIALIVIVALAGIGAQLLSRELAVSRLQSSSAS